MQEQEIWEKVPNHENYEVSNLGNVRFNGCYKAQKDGTTRYYPPRRCKIGIHGQACYFSCDGKHIYLSKIVAELFVPNPQGVKQHYHLDGDFSNNKASNIKWGREEQIIIVDNNEGLTEKEYIAKHYLIQNDGIIIRIQDNKRLMPSLDDKGYYRIRLKVPAFAKHKDRHKNYSVHRLVAMYYLDDYSDDLQVNHKNGVKHDNRVENLEMVAPKENSIHAWYVLDSSKRMEKLELRRDKKTGRFL